MFKSLSTICLSYIVISSAVADDNVTITMDIEGATYGNGQIMCAIYDSKSSFLKEPAGKMIVQIDENNQAQCVFENMPKGVYAASAVYDLDSNGELKTNFIGIPKEPVGMSNNHKPRFGPPKFKKSKQQVTGDHVFNIKVDAS